MVTWRSALLLLLGCLAASVAGSEEEVPRYPLWDGRETVEHYAARVGLPPRRELSLPNGGVLEMALVPAAEFRMGVPVPERPSEAVDHSYWALVFSACVLAALVAFMIARACRLRRRFQFSLAYLMLMTASASCFVGTAVHSWLLAEAWKEYERRLAQSWSVEESQKPPHWVTISRPFYLSLTEVTRAQYAAVCGEALLPHSVPIRGNPDVIPVLVDFMEARAFCLELRRRHGLAFRLPTEAEHEWVSTVDSGVGFCAHRHDVKRLDCLAYGGTIPPLYQVGIGKPNAFGLHDLNANAWEWCVDWYGPYEEIAARDPHGALIGRERVVRGVNRLTTDGGCLPSCRWRQAPGFIAGLRLALDVRDVAAVGAEEEKTDRTLAIRALHEKLKLARCEIENCVVNRTSHEIMEWTDRVEDPRWFCVLRQQLLHINAEKAITFLDVAVLDSAKEARALFECRAKGTPGFWDSRPGALGDESRYTYMGSWDGRKDHLVSEVYLRRGRLYLHAYTRSLGAEPLSTHFSDVCETFLAKYERLEQTVMAERHDR